MCHPAILAQTNSLLTLFMLNMMKNILKLYLFLNIVRSFETKTSLGERSMFFLKSNFCSPNNNNNATFQIFFFLIKDNLHQERDIVSSSFPVLSHEISH